MANVGFGSVIAIKPKEGVRNGTHKKGYSCSRSTSIILALPACADAVYSYTGNRFTQANVICCGQPLAGVIPGFISGTFTLTDPLAANLAPGTDISSMLVSFDFTANNGNPEGPGTPGVVTLMVGTDSKGAIDDWEIRFYEDAGYDPNYITTYNDPIGVIDHWDAPEGHGYTEFVSNDPGTWVGPVPEPGTLTLFSSGLTGVAGLLRRRLKFK